MVATAPGQINGTNTPQSPGKRLQTASLPKVMGDPVDPVDLVDLVDLVD